MGRKKNKNKPQVLPISKYKDKILESVEKNQVTIITGATGCGKSTQVPKYLWENNYASEGIIACLHPRCVAAMSLASRVSHELNSNVGELVGYRIRFFTEKSSETKILFMTMGFLLQLLKFDEEINKYSVIIIDEAHERSIHTDVVLGKTKQMIAANTDLKIIIMSATLDVKEISDFYGLCGFIQIPTKNDQVTVIYRPPKSSDYVAAIRQLVEEILRSTKTGHVLIFLPSEQKVSQCCRVLRNLPGTRTLPLFSNLDEIEKYRVFENYGNRRKLIATTNVAETSLTIPGVDFVIDSGFVKRVRFDHATGYECWITELVSVAEANQRKGRTGRTGPGTCYRLYEDYRMAPEPQENRFQDFPDPEVLRADLGALLIALAAFQIRDVFDFPFVVPPRQQDVSSALKLLRDLSLFHDDEPVLPSNKNGIETDHGDDLSPPCSSLSKIGVDRKSRGMQLTALGEAASRLPLDPRLAKVVAVAKDRLSERECEDVLAIVATQSMRSLYSMSANVTGVRDDLLACRDVFRDVGGHLKGGPVRYACQEAGVDFSPLKYAWRVFRQLRGLVKLTSSSKGAVAVKGNAHDNAIKKAFLAGFFDHVAVCCSSTQEGQPNKFLGGGLYGDQHEMLMHKQSRVDPNEDVVLCIKLQKQVDKGDMVMRILTGLNRDMLRALDPKKYKIKSNLWARVLEHL